MPYISFSLASFFLAMMQHSADAGLEGQRKAFLAAWLVLGLISMAASL